MAFFNLFGKRQDPAKAANPFLQQIPGVATQQLNPYIQQGQAAGTAALGTYGQMAQDPAAFINQLMSGYTPSKGFQFQRDEALQALQNSANAGGFAGTRQDQLQQGQLAQSLASQDMYNWLNTVLGAQGTGLAGQQHFADQGYGANASLTDILTGALNQQGGLAFQGATQANQNRNDLIKGIMQMGGAALGFGMQPSASLFGNKIW